MPQRRVRKDAPVIKWWSKWGSGGAETEWLRLAGFTRRNTRRAILKFLTYGLLAG